MNTRELVANALANSIANGYDPMAMTEDELVADLLSYDADLEGRSHSAVSVAVRAWRKENASCGT